MRVRMTIPADQIRTDSDRQAIEDGCYWDEAAGLRVIRFVEKYVRPRGGRLAKGKRFNLFSWQRAVLMTLFSWKRKSDGTRRFRTGYISLARQNGKSFLMAAIALYMLLADDEIAPAVCCAATKQSQSALIYNYLKFSIDQNEELKECTHPLHSSQRIEVPATSGTFDSLSCDVEGALGSSYSCIIFDELAFHPTDRLVAYLEPCTTTRLQPLTLAITTAGTNFNGIGYSQYDYACKVRDSKVIDTSFFSAIFEADEAASLTDPVQLKKANPSLDEGLIDLDELKQAASQAKHSKAKELHFRYFRHNRWQAGIDTYFDLGRWDECKGEYPQFPKGTPIYCALDGSKGKDLNACTALVPWEDKFYVFYHAWLPQAAYNFNELNGTKSYKTFIDEGTLTVTPGEASDRTQMRKWIYGLSPRFKVQSVFYDPNYLTDTIEDLKKNRYNLVRFAQTPANYTDPVKTLESWILTQKIVHDGTELLRWQIGNTAVDTKTDDKLMPMKGKSSGKIDNVVCLLMTVAAANPHEAKKKESPYKTRGIVWV